MQDRTIDNALLALRKQGGTQGKLAEVLLDMRGVDLPAWYQNKPFKRGGTKHIVMTALEGGGKTNAELTKAIQALRPDITHRAAANRSYQCLLRLEERGVVVRDFGPDGCLWRVD